MTYIGIDFHKRSFTVCYRQSADKETIRAFKTTDEDIEDFLKTVNCLDVVAIEAIGFCRYFVKKLQPHVAKVTLVNASKNLLITKSTKKTDEHDASMLAYGLEHGLLPLARFRTEAAQQLRSMLCTRQMLVMMHVRAVNTLYAITARNGQLFEKEQLLYKLWRDRIKLEELQFGDLASITALEGQVDHLHRDILLLKNQIEKACREMPGYDVLASIPGFGPIRRATVLATIDRIEDFSSPKKLC